MAVVQKLLDLDSYYKVTTGAKIILNDLDPFDIDDIETINNSLMTVYDSDVISTVPTCDCGATKVRYMLGRECPECSTIVADPQEQTDPVMWLKHLDSMPGFINPSYWLMLKSLLSTKIDYIRWLTDTSYNPPIEVPSHIHGCLEIIGSRDYSNFVHNIDKVLIYLSTLSKFKDPNTLYSINVLLDMYKNQSNKVFSTYLPVVNKKLFVMENTSKGKFTNLAVSGMIDIIMLWVKASSSELSTKRKSNMTASMLSKMSILYKDHFKDYVSGKIGIFRKHVYSARSHFTFRAVISSIAGRHNYDEIHVPWSIGVTAFRPHIVNKLFKMGYKYKDINSMMFRAVKLYMPIIDEILQSLIAEAPGGKLYVIEQRNLREGFPA